MTAASDFKKTLTRTYQSDFVLPSELPEQIAVQGFDALSELIRIPINTAINDRIDRTATPKPDSI
jgi:hypothetical protein